MKKILSTITIVSALIATSCTKEMQDKAQTGSIESEVVSMDLGVASETTKTVINGSSVEWMADDEIAVYDATGSKCRFSTNEESVSGKNAQFTGKVDVRTTTISAVYPYDAAADVIGDNYVCATLPDAQVIGDGLNVAKGALVSVATAAAKLSGTAMAFTNVFGLVKVSVTYKDVTSITVNGTNVAGTAKINPTTGEIMEITSGKSSVTVTYSGEKGTAFPQGDYFIAVLPGTTVAGNFSVTVTRASEMSAMKTATKDVVIARNCGKNLAELDTILEWVYTINNLERFKTFIANAQNFEEGNKAIVSADIDCGGTDPGIASSFKGIFDGQNHRIYNYVTSRNGNAGLFNTVTGSAVIKNLIIGSSDGTTYDGVSKITTTTTAAADAGYSYASVIAQTADNSNVTIENVINFCNVEAASSATHKVRVAGIVAGWKSLASMTACKNYGKIVINAPTSDNTCIAGGIIAYCERQSTITGCENYGDVESFCDKTTQMGGIFADMNSDSNKNKTDLVSCKNFGAVKLSVPTTAAVYVGGIAGRSLSANLTGCENVSSASVAFEATSAMSNSINLGGLSGYASTGVFDACQNYGKVTDQSGVCTGTKKIGGIAACNENSAGKYKDCQNHGEITLSCNFNTTAGNVYLGGLIGTISQAAAFEGNILNEGNISIAGTVNSINVGGIIGQIGASSAFDKFRNYGTISTKGSMDVKGNPYIAGIVGNVGNNVFTVTACENHGAITLDFAQSNQAYVAGIHGNISTPKTAGVDFKDNVNTADLTMKITKATNTANYYLAGISSTGNNGIKYTSCKNTGNLTFEGPAQIRIGGIASYSGYGFDNVEVKCNISAKCTGTNNSQIGGIVGYSSNTNFNGCKFEGTVDTSNSTAKVYAGGLIGKINANGNFNGCSFKGEVKTATPGLYIGGLQGSNKTFTFGATTACKVGTGSKLNGVVVAELSNDNLAAQSSDDGKLSSTSTLTNISIAD